MAKPATDLTKAVWNLLKANKGKLTYSEALPQLRQLGFKLSDDPKSDDFKKERSRFDVTKYSWNRSAGASRSQKPTGSKNTKARTAAKSSRKAGRKSGPQPKYAPTAKTPRVVRQPRVKPTTEHDLASQVAAVEQVEQMGGVAAVKAKLAELEQQASALRETLEKVAALHERTVAA